MNGSAVKQLPLDREEPLARPKFWEPTAPIARPEPIEPPPDEKDIPYNEWPLVFERANAALRKAIEEDEARMKEKGDSR